MRQDGDTLTMELPGLEPKRGRGRPRKPDALTPAQRAQRYRDKKARRRRLLALRIRYQGPNGETWTGRGLMPRWLTVLLERGHKLAEFDLQGRPDGRT